jgi:hypothetical protein
VQAPEWPSTVLLDGDDSNVLKRSHLSLLRQGIDRFVCPSQVP